MADSDVEFTIPRWASLKMSDNSCEDFHPDSEWEGKDSNTSVFFYSNVRDNFPELQDFFITLQVPFEINGTRGSGESLRAWIHFDESNAKAQTTIEKKLGADEVSNILKMVRDKKYDEVESELSAYEKKSLPHKDFNLGKVKPTGWNKLAFAILHKDPVTVSQVMSEPDQSIQSSINNGGLTQLLNTLDHQDIDRFILAIKAASFVVKTPGNINNNSTPYGNTGWGYDLIKKRCFRPSELNELIPMLYPENSRYEFDERMVSDIESVASENKLNAIDAIERLYRVKLIPECASHFERLINVADAAAREVKGATETLQKLQSIALTRKSKAVSSSDSYANRLAL